jgi:hypothetical protein
LPGLNPHDFYLSETHKHIFCNATPADDEEAFHHHTMDACQAINNYLGIFERMQCFMMRCVKACTESHEDILSDNSERICFLTHVDMNTFSVSIYGTNAQSLCAPFSYILYGEQREKYVMT